MRVRGSSSTTGPSADGKSAPGGGAERSARFGLHPPPPPPSPPGGRKNDPPPPPPMPPAGQ
ncbi:hypothetical protein FRUB_02426 [Fimbriiglobus ruber]|uniref:Uncharacterized protein n=1 Tax=Fimbriiglobus ruber TaxID=1908690 RepID=A0A225DY43_9BACT|nr:hypothetical protein FRUB_02426 [Fimbriiglobus ruber]